MAEWNRGTSGPRLVAQPVQQQPPVVKEPKRKRYRTAVMRAERAGAALVAGLRLFSLLLVVASVVGTFYGIQARDVPANIMQVAIDMGAAPILVGVAVATQTLLTLGQWGGRSLGLSAHPGWWGMYLAALALSVGLNFSYETLLFGLGLPVVAVYGIIIAADVLPEWILID